MDPFADITPLWDLSQATNFSQLPDDDFLALLQKQFPATSQPGAGFGGFTNSINPQSISQFPNQSPASDDSSPSPPRSGEYSSKQSPSDMQEDNGESALKRKASFDDPEEGPSQKNQHTASGSKKGATTAKRKSSGSAPDESRLLKRKEQNRAAQRAFRERKEKHVKDLEDKVAALEAKNEQANTENENLRDLLTRLQSENMALKQQQPQSSGMGQSSFTFSVPKNAASATSPSVVKDPTFQTSMFSSLPRFSYTGPDNKFSNPLNMTSLMSFDPNVLNLLDESSQPTATDSARQMDFNFGPEDSFTPSNYTMIANNPAFFSLASAFDHASLPSSSPNPSASPATTSTSNNDQNSFGFDLSSLAPWPMSQDAGTLDDLFGGGFFNPPHPNMDFSSFLTASPSSSSVSPVVHHSNLNNSQFNGQSPATSVSSSPSSHGSDPSLFSAREGSSSDSEMGHDESECPKTKKECAERIQNSGPSFFAPTNTSVTPTPVSPVSLMDHEQSDMALMKSVACQKGLSPFPTTEVNEHNVEVLSAWRSITRDPSFKECDINSLCKEFTSKARCDGTKVVIEPQGIQGAGNPY
ncbi:DNA-binding transcription factor yap1, variant 2 [Stygiomarasmius scandens]|uniref:DNA-binding transcription factor yap1, variant 2 n=1 Tax=Marasmiellus scandens TaxID=2682957 RepID=A0ABR1K267_9AGAR